MSHPKPYIMKTVTYEVWNPEYPSEATCGCGHPYYRHFDHYAYSDMEPIGCEYCDCWKFVEPTEKS